LRVANRARSKVSGATRDVRFGPIADIPSYSIIVGALLNRQRDKNAKRPGGFEIDDQLELEIGAWTGSSFGLATLRIRSA